ncbi:MAG TPA: hypothetical protein VE825_10770, partial [Terriglobales bacterium]|nr:hypothetical protein [Terriglobales bacterium]
MWKGLHRLLRRFPHQYEGSGFSVAVQSVGRETVRILYTRGGRSLDLLADCYGGARASIHVRVPKDMSADGVAQMVQDLSEALANLGFGYEIYRTGDPQVVPEEERRRALAELRAMGMDATVQGNTIKTT